MRQLLSVTQARTRLSLGQTKFYELLRTGELRSVKIGARRLIPTEAIDEYIAGLQGEGSSALTAGGDAA